VTFLADVPEHNDQQNPFDAVHIETLVVAGCDVFNPQLALQLQQAKVSDCTLPNMAHHFEILLMKPQTPILMSCLVCSRS
jgi:hypothetical protein